MKLIKVNYIGYEGNGESEEISAYDIEQAYPNAEYAVYSYRTGSFEGDGDIIVKQSGKFYHSSLGHCSCYGPTDNLNIEPFNNIEELLKKCSLELSEGLVPIIDKIKELESK